MNAQAEAQVTWLVTKVCQPAPWTVSPMTEATLMAPPGLSNSTITSRARANSLATARNESMSLCSRTPLMVRLAPVCSGLTHSTLNSAAWAGVRSVNARMALRMVISLVIDNGLCRTHRVHGKCAYGYIRCASVFLDSVSRYRYVYLVEDLYVYDL